MANTNNFDNLSDEAQQVILRAKAYFEDCFDSSGGGPHLSDVEDARFDNEKYVLLALAALDYINMTQPYTEYTIDQFPYSPKYDGVLVQGIVVEAIRHFKRAFVEQINPQSLGVAYVDRRDYVQRWDSILTDEMKQRDHLLKNFKRQHMNLGRSKMIVAGQRYGRYWPSVRPGSWPRPRF